MRKAKGRGGKGSSREKKRAPKKTAARAPATKPYRYLDHPADVGFLARGRDLPQLFAHAALALCDYGWDLKRIRPAEEVRLRVRAATLEDLLYSWLSEILYLSDAEGWVFKRFAVERVAQSSGGQPKQKGLPLWEAVGRGQGEKFEAARHRARTYIKAVTYHQLLVEQRGRRWQAQVFLDV